MFKRYIKWKLISMIKDKLIYYSQEKAHYLERQNEWICKVYDDKYMSKERFQKEQTEQIRWCSEQWKMNHYKAESVLDILRIVESM